MNKNFWETWGQTNAIYNAWANTKKINYYLAFVLYALDNYQISTQKKICEYTGITKQTVNSVIKTLKKNNYVTLSANLDDGREKQVSLTDEGRKYAKEILTPLYVLEDTVFNMMGKERVKEMIDSLYLFNTIFEKELKGKYGGI